MARKPPRWYFSFRSPYSWFAYRDLTSRYADVAREIEWIPFWEPDQRTERMLDEAGAEFPYVPMSRDKHLYILQDTRRLAAERDLTMTWPVDRNPCWEVAHLGYFVARELGHGPQFIDAVYRARWEQGRDISDPVTIAEIATEIGADPAALTGAPDDQEIRELGVSALSAGHRDGVFGVPFFVKGYDKYWGVERLPGFVAAMRSTKEKAEPGRAAEVVLTPASDGGHAGGCG
jgi:2-hydroxychromene-2-carboxylate isomerase